MSRRCGTRPAPACPARGEAGRARPTSTSSGRRAETAIQTAPVISEAELQTARLCVVGGINRDLKTAPFPPGAHLLQDGETTVQSITETVGGGGANSACIAAGLGAPVAFVGRLGADDLGARLGATLTANGVVCYLHQDTASPTGTTLNLVYESGSRHFLSRHPNNEALSFDDLDLEPGAAADHLLRADVWCSEPMLYGGNDELFRRAGEAGVAVSLDLNWHPRSGADPAAEIDRRKRAVRDLLADDLHRRISTLSDDGHQPRWDGSDAVNAIEDILASTALAAVKDVIAGPAIDDVIPSTSN